MVASGGDEEEYEVGKAPANEDEIIDDNAMIESNIDPQEWKLELERVAPQLRTMVIADSKDWRSHLERAKHRGEWWQYSVKAGEKNFSFKKLEYKRSIRCLKNASLL